MPLRVYNTLNRKKETFKPLKDKKVNLFVCGITAYDYPHLGHARTYIVFDMIVKYLRQKGYKVFYLQNITDIDDKIIKRAKEKNISSKKLAQEFEKIYLEDMKSLTINSVDKYARATDHIEEIISQVKRLKEKGFAYKIKDGIYFNLEKFKDYGKLSGRTTQQAEDAVSRIDESKEKKNKGDFCLWKFSKEKEPQWESPFSSGRPGWHIEDTAITEKYFGAQYDVHGGARDLIFPHHEAEIAQMESLSGKKPMVNYWMHAGFLTVEGEKMSKSKGNFITIRDFLKNYSPRTLRLFVLKSHYRSPIDYNEAVLKQTKKQIEKIDEFLSRLRNYKGDKKSKDLVAKAKKEFEEAMEDDFNTPDALASIFNLIKKANSALDKKELSSKDKKEILNFLKEKDKIFSFILSKEKEEIPEEVLKLIKKREDYREKQQWEKADEIRKRIRALGYKIKDTSQGPKIKKKRKGVTLLKRQRLIK